MLKLLDFRVNTTIENSAFIERRLSTERFTDDEATLQLRVFVSRFRLSLEPVLSIDACGQSHE